jgi:hypothetical protein
MGIPERARQNEEEKKHAILRDPFTLCDPFTFTLLYGATVVGWSAFVLGGSFMPNRL